MEVSSPMALVRKPPQMLEVCAHQLWSGDMLDEVNLVLALGRTKPGFVSATIAAVDPREAPPVGREMVKRDFAWCERMKVVRGMQLPSGSYLTQFDIWGNCHGYKYPPGSPKPCDCEWHD